MKKRIFIFPIIIFALALTSCRGRSQRLTPINEENVEYHPLVTDSAAIDSINNAGMVDTDEPLEIPEIPKDKSIDMNASDAEIMDVMSGSGDGELTKEADPLKQ